MDNDLLFELFYKPEYEALYVYKGRANTRVLLLLIQMILHFDVINIAPVIIKYYLTNLNKCVALIIISILTVKYIDPDL